MINLPAILQEAYPALDLNDIVIVDHRDGKGEVIDEWKSPIQRPTQAQLQALYDAWKFGAPQRDLDNAFADKEKEIRAEGTNRLAALAGNYSPTERETWATQQREARAWLTDNHSQTPMLSALAAARGVTLSALVDKVMQNVSAFEAASGTILGQQQAVLDQLYAIDLNAADALNQIAAINWS